MSGLLAVSCIAWLDDWLCVFGGNLPGASLYNHSVKQTMIKYASTGTISPLRNMRFVVAAVVNKTQQSASAASPTMIGT
jgi:hypothetical protein